MEGDGWAARRGSLWALRHRRPGEAVVNGNDPKSPIKLSRAVAKQLEPEPSTRSALEGRFAMGEADVVRRCEPLPYIPWAWMKACRSRA